MSSLITDEGSRRIPLATMGMVGLCSSLHVLQFLFQFPLQGLTLCPRLVLYLHEYYRIMTSALFHANLMHIGMNMMSAVALGAILERRIGTSLYLMTTLWSILLTSLLHIAIAWTASAIFHHDSIMYGHSVGFSAVLFHLSVMECNLGSHTSRTIFGLVNVPAQLYPWVLLVLLQFMIPNLSFLGHLCGIITGTMQSYGMLDILLVKQSFVKEMEESDQCHRCLVNTPYFIHTPHPMLLYRDPSALWHTLCNGMGAMLRYTRYIAEAMKVIVLGRGRQANVNNVQLVSTNSSNSDHHHNPWVDRGRGHRLGSPSNDRDEENSLLPDTHRNPTQIIV